MAALLYFTLQGEMPYHDAPRFINQVASGAFVWDIAHVLLQPAALLLHRWTGASPAGTLKALSSLSAAAAAGVFHLLLLRLRVPRWQAVLGTVLLAGCCSVLTLAPSAHPKLVAFPFITGALLGLCMAERHGMRSDREILLAGVLLALGAGFLASTLALVPFAVIAVVLVARRGGAAWSTAVRQGVLLGGACGFVFLVIACAGYVLLTGESLSVAGLANSVVGKADLRPAPIPMMVHIARLVFGTINTFIAVPGVGATLQAWMRGQVPSLQPYAGLLPLALLWLLGGVLTAAIYVTTAMALLRRQACLIPAAFLCGAQAWAFWYGVNDPELGFLLTAPTIVLFLIAMPPVAIRRVLPAWAVIATVANLALLAVPVATYPLASNATRLASMLGPKDLLVVFAAYPGRPYTGFFTMPGVRTLSVDLRIQKSGSKVDDALRSVDADLTHTLQAGGRVLVANILDPTDWEAPWMGLLSQGVTKRRLDETLLASRTAQRVGDVGGIKLWELHPAGRPS